MQTNFMVDDNPCHGCTERFPACSARCPKEARGERGYDTWSEEERAMKARYKEYRKQYNEDYMRSEEFDWKRRLKGRGR